MGVFVPFKYVFRSKRFTAVFAGRAKVFVVVISVGMSLQSLGRCVSFATTGTDEWLQSQVDVGVFLKRFGV